MNSPTFFQTTLTCAALAGAVAWIPGRVSAADSGQPQYYELRIYSTKSEQQQKLVSDYWQNAGVPAYNRMGIQPVGVFTELQDSPTNRIYVLIPCDSLEVFAAIPARLAADAAYQAAAAQFMAMPKTNSAYERIESSLNVAFDTMKKLAPPPSAAGKTPWIFRIAHLPKPQREHGPQQSANVQQRRVGPDEGGGAVPGLLLPDTGRPANAESDLHAFRREPGRTRQTL